jgi:hypothetical protein
MEKTIEKTLLHDELDNLRNRVALLENLIVSLLQGNSQFGAYVIKEANRQMALNKSRQNRPLPLTESVLHRRRTMT